MTKFKFLLICALTTFSMIAQEWYNIPLQKNDGWITGDLFENHSSNRFNQLFKQLDPKEFELHSMLVIKNDSLLLESYFNDYDLNTTHDLRSTSKSIISLLLGIAIDKGFITSVEDPIFDYLKDLKPKKNLDSRKNKILIKHLITMSTGLECNDWDKKSKGQEDRVYKRKDDWLQYTVDLEMAEDPGANSAYCSMGVTLAARIIENSSGMSLDNFAQKYLFAPLGIKDVNWKHTSKKKDIASASKRLHMLPRDMAKIGQLVLNKGLWNGEQVVSSNWINISTSVHTKITNIDYGYLWWKIPFKYKDRVLFVTTATGNGGQYIMIIPKLELVVVFTGGAYNSQEDKLPFAIMKDVFIPTFME